MGPGCPDRRALTVLTLGGLTVLTLGGLTVLTLGL